MVKHNLVHGSLFSGIGGFDLGFERIGIPTVITCEKDHKARSVLKKRFPSADHLEDVKEVTSISSDVNLLSAGFPCQDISSSSPTKGDLGIKGSRSSLVWEVFRIMYQNPQVHTVVLENVVNLGRTNRGEDLKAILNQFDRMGFRWSFNVLNAAFFGVPQFRRRLFIVASKDPGVFPWALALEGSPGPPVVTEGSIACMNVNPLFCPAFMHLVPTFDRSPSNLLITDGSGLHQLSLEGWEKAAGFPEGWGERLELSVSARKAMLGNAVVPVVASEVMRRILRPSEDNSTGQPFEGSLWKKRGWGRRGERYLEKMWEAPEDPKLGRFTEQDYLNFKSGLPTASRIKALEASLDLWDREGYKNPRTFKNRKIQLWNPSIAALVRGGLECYSQISE